MKGKWYMLETNRSTTILSPWQWWRMRKHTQEKERQKELRKTFSSKFFFLNEEKKNSLWRLFLGLGYPRPSGGCPNDVVSSLMSHRDLVLSNSYDKMYVDVALTNTFSCLIWLNTFPYCEQNLVTQLQTVHWGTTTNRTLLYNLSEWFR